MTDSNSNVHEEGHLLLNDEYDCFCTPQTRSIGSEVSKSRDEYSFVLRS